MPNCVIRSKNWLAGLWAAYNTMPPTPHVKPFTPEPSAAIRRHCRAAGYIQSGCLEPTPQQKACTGDGIHRAKPPSETLDGNSLAQGKAQQRTDDRVDRDGGGNVAVLGANQLGSDQASPPGGIRWRAPTVLRRLSVRIPHTPDAISVSGNRHGKRQRKRPGCLGPAFFRSRPPYPR